MKATVKSLLFSSLIVTLAFVFSLNEAVAQDSTSQAAQGKTVMEVVQNKDDISDFAQMLEKSGYGKVLAKEGPYTILAPSNEAIKAEKESGGKGAVQAKGLIKGHLYQGEIPADQIESQMDVTVTATDKSAGNGIVHIVDKVVKNNTQ